MYSLLFSRITRSIPTGRLDTFWKIKDADGYILNNDGTRSACVHQWDRFYGEVQPWLDISFMQIKGATNESIRIEQQEKKRREKVAAKKKALAEALAQGKTAEEFNKEFGDSQGKRPMALRGAKKRGKHL